MAEEAAMTPQNGTFDAQQQWGRLSERVENQGKDIIDLRSNMNTGFSNVNANLNTLSNDLRNSSKTQWPAIWAALSVGVGILGGLGYLALTPTKDNVSRLEDALVRSSEANQATISKLADQTQASIQAITANMVTQKEMEWRSERSAEDRARSDKAIDEIRSVMLPRAEWSERNLSRDHDIENLRADAVRDTANLQRQLDLQRSDFQAFASSMGNGRDFITDLKDEVNRLREAQAETRSLLWRSMGAARSAPP